MLNRLFSGNYRRCLILDFFWSMNFGMPVSMLFFGRFGAGPSWVMAFQVLGAMTTVVVDAPCGWLAVRFGAKRVMIVGLWAQVCQSLYLSFVCRTKGECIVVMMMLGLSWGLTQGTSRAIVKQTVPNKVATFPRHSMLARGFGQIVSVIVAYVTVRHFGITGPFMFQSIPFALGLLVALTVHDPHLSSRLTHPEFSSIVDISRKLWQREELRWIILLSALLSTAVLSMTWFVQSDLSSAGLKVTSVSLIFGVRAVSNMIFTLLGKRFDKRFNGLSAQGMLVAITATGALAGALPYSVGTIIALVACSVVSAFAEPIMWAAVEQHMPELEEHAATVYSISTAVQSLLFAVSPLLGLVSQRLSTDATYFAISVLTCGFGCYFLYQYALLLARPVKKPEILTAS